MDALNESTAPNDVRVTTALGDKRFTSAGTSGHAVWTFAGSGASLAAGKATVKSFPLVNGVAYNGTITTSYPQSAADLPRVP